MGPVRRDAAHRGHQARERAGSLQHVGSVPPGAQNREHRWHNHQGQGKREGEEELWDFAH